MTIPYNPTEIEASAQAYWEKHHSFRAKENSPKQKFYCLSMLPYPSGELHMGHVRNYTIGDVIARYHHMLGDNVLQPMGWDAFGLPAENAALKNKLAPSQWTYQNIEQMRNQLKQLGFAIDWEHEVTTCKPEYYRWEQWLFIQLYQKGLAYKKNALVNWDPVDQTILANEQVVDGRGWRSGAVIERREIPQWFLKITDYADQLLNDLDQLTGWPEQVRTMQRHWIGRSEGLAINFSVTDHPETITIFTTRPDTLMGATAISIAPEHPLALQLAQQNKTIADFVERCRHTKVAEAEMATAEKKGIQTSLFAVHPITNEKLPIWIANFVLMDYGSGAVMCVPAHDQRDFEFAQKYHLPLKIVIQPLDNSSWDFQKAAYTEKGILINSEQYSGLTFEQALNTIANDLIREKKGMRQTHYRLRDWGISRQRYWGTPIPIIYCKSCGAVAVPEKDLPVVLPENIALETPQSPLKSLPSFYETTCPQCGKPATRETDTFDTFMESSWYYARYCCPDQSGAMLDERVNYWMPADQYVGGIEHAIMHLLYSRFIYKVLRDEGLIKSDEPFKNLLTQGMVLKDGAKMSKSKGNVVSPALLIEKYGADTARLFMMFAAPPELSLEWSDSGVEGSHRFLKRLWNYAISSGEFIKSLNKNSSAKEIVSKEAKDIRRQIHEILQQANNDINRLQFNTVVSAAMKIFNLLPKLPAENISEQLLAQETLSTLLRVLAPITPHITHHLWRELGFGEDILHAPWPKADTKLLETGTTQITVQVNGKVRAHISIPSQANEETIREMALAHDNVKRFLDNKPYKKIIVVPNKLINIVV